jgi:hypothetical protein
MGINAMVAICNTLKVVYIHFKYNVLLFRDFIHCCGAALDLNDQLIQDDQKMYQEDLKDKYSSMRHELASYIDLVSFEYPTWPELLYWLQLFHNVHSKQVENPTFGFT